MSGSVSKIWEDAPNKDPQQGKKILGRMAG
jgi:hypothetical protein